MDGMGKLRERDRRNSLSHAQSPRYKGEGGGGGRRKRNYKEENLSTMQCL